VVEPDGRVRSWTAELAALTGLAPEDVVGHSIKALRLAPEDDAIAAVVVEELLQTGSWRGELAIHHVLGPRLRLRIRAAVLEDRSVLVAAAEVSQVDAENSVDMLTSKLHLVQSIGELGCWEWDPITDRLIMSEQFVELLGLRFDPEQTMAAALEVIPREDHPRVLKALETLRHDPSPQRFEYRVRRTDGTLYTLEAHCEGETDDSGAVIAVRAVSVNVTHRVLQAEELRRSQQELRMARNYLRAVTDHVGEGLFAIDCDGRLTYMNPVAEELLGWRAAELAGQVAHDVFHHTTADGQAYPSECCQILRARREGQVVRVQDEVFVRRDGRLLPVAYTAAPFQSDDGAEGCVVVFADVTERRDRDTRIQHDLEKLAWLKRVKDALPNQRLVLHGQPIIDLRTGKRVQRELLLRMRGARAGDSGLIPPGRFLPVAEEYGFIGEIDRWVVDQATELAVTRSVELNVSAHSVSDPAFVDHVRSALKRTGADPATLTFEITETALIENEEAARGFVEDLHRLGCRVALDDFGTGYGGFTYLKQLPIDYLKIDIEFVRDLCHNSASRKVVEAVISLAKGFGLQTIAEGVEDEDTLTLLRELGADMAQGYHIGVPAPLE